MPFTSSLYQLVMPDDLVRLCRTHSHLLLLLTATVYGHYEDLILLPFDDISCTSRIDAGLSESIHPSICGRHSLFCTVFGTDVSTSQTSQTARGEMAA